MEIKISIGKIYKNISKTTNLIVINSKLAVRQKMIHVSWKNSNYSAGLRSKCKDRKKIIQGCKNTYLTLAAVNSLKIKFAIEIKDQPKKALEGIAVFLYYFN